MRIVLTGDAFRHLNLAGVVSPGRVEQPQPTFGESVPHSGGGERTGTHGENRTPSSNVRSVAPVVHRRG